MLQKISFQIICKNKKYPSEKEMKQWIKAAFPPKKSMQLNVRLVTPKEIQNLNRIYRGKNKTTDILSFPFQTPKTLKSNFKGDIVLCPTEVNFAAKKQKKNLKAHWAHLLVHGTLHLLDFEHDTVDGARKMMSHEVKILNSFGISNPYREAYD